MSLNGLDAPQLHQIFESACAEAGSWFLLQYTSRDEVELLAKGASGTQEMRERIAQEPTDSPLYGFIRYRRRNILVKYIPEGTSRVLRARSQVHFQLVGERFTPHDVIFAMAAACDLTDSALTSACSTHSASASISSSSSSLRNRRLADIAESAEETQQPPGRRTHAGAARALSDGGSGDTVAEDDGEDGEGAAADGVVALLGPTVVITTDDPPGLGVDPPSSHPRQGHQHQPSPTAAAPVHQHNHNHAHAHAHAHNHSHSHSPLGSLSSRNLSSSHLSTSPAESQRRGSSSSDTRPPVTDIYASLYAPKIKLGPRLSADALRRPQTANSNSSSFAGSVEDLRPVASVPKSVHLPQRKPKARANSLSADAAHQPPPVPILPPVEATPKLQAPQPPPPVALQSAPEPEAKPTPPAPLGPPVLSPEKQRLMRALQLRKSTLKHEGESSPETVNMSSDIVTVSAVAMEPADSSITTAADHNHAATKQQQTKGESEGLLPSNIKTGTDDLPENAKVRGSDNEHDSDVSSVASVEIAVAQPRPASATESRPPMNSLSSPDGQTSLAQRPATSHQENRASPAPIVLTKRNQKEQTATAPEDPVVETARSVSAPFLNNARGGRASIAVPRTVTVNSGSVFARIKQLEMLNRNAPPAATQPPIRATTVRVSPSLSPSSGVGPFSRRAASPNQMPPGPFPLERTLSLPMPSQGPGSNNSVPSIPLKSRARPDMRCDTKMSLEVTTIIPRNKETPEVSATSNDPSTSNGQQEQPSTQNVQQQAPETPSPVVISVVPPPQTVTSMAPAPTVMASLKDLEASTPMASSRRSLDMSSMFSSGRKNTDNGASVKEKKSFKEKLSSTILHKLNIDSEASSPSSPASPLASPKSSSPISPAPVSGKPKSIFGRDKEKSNEKKQEKKQEKQEKQDRQDRQDKLDKQEKQEKLEKQERQDRQDRLDRQDRQEKQEKSRSRSKSPKPKKSLLRRMSSLTKKSREPVAVVQAAVEPQKVNLLVGWVNVQLPDTMLWRRKCIKIDSLGWLFLAVTEDETAPGTRRYHIPSDVRVAKIPDPDEQELPFSVQLDLYEGGTLQCACQNSVEQREVLAIIQESFV
ncbi:hypothetical protein DFH27DRAFT_4810 [Peziza echinospora]|nr:hypothetical protein DFH27DRAFT_4810 [Peziza echinospora]